MTCARRGRRHRTVPLIAMVIGMVVGAGLAGCATPGAAAADEVRVGVILPLSGQTAESGQNSRRGIELAADLINANGGVQTPDGRKRIRLDIKDSTSEPGRAAAAAIQFLSRGEPPVALIGAYASSLTATVAQAAERRQVPLLTTSFSDELVTSGFDYIFQVAPKASEVGAAQLDYTLDIAEEEGEPIEDIGIVFANNAYGASQAEGLRDRAGELGLRVALYEPYPPETANLTPVARKVTAAEPDVIMAVSYVTDGVLLVRALKSLGSDVPVVGGVGGFITPDFERNLGRGVEGILSVNTSSPDAYGDIGERYRQRYGEFMPQEAHDNAACLYIVTEALSEHYTEDPERFAQALRTSGPYQLGAAGSMPGGRVEFAENGANSVIEPLMTQWQDGELTSVWPPDFASSRPRWSGGSR